MPGYTRTEAEQRWSLQEVIREIDGWRVLGSSGLKKLEIIVRQSTFDAIRTDLQDLSVSGLAVSEVRVWGKPGHAPHFYRGVQCDAISPRFKLEMLIEEDLISRVLTIVWEHDRSAGDGVVTRAVVCDASAAVCVWPPLAGLPS